MLDFILQLPAMVDSWDDIMKLLRALFRLFHW